MRDCETPKDPFAGMRRRGPTHPLPGSHNPECDADGRPQNLERPASASKVEQGSGPYYTTNRQSELDALPIPYVDYTWLPSTPAEEVEPELRKQLAHLHNCRVALSREMEVLNEWLSVNEMRFYARINSGSTARHGGDSPESVNRIQQYCQTLGSAQYALHLEIANTDWLIADCEKRLEQNARLAAGDSIVTVGLQHHLRQFRFIPETTLKRLRERQTALNRLESYYENLISMLRDERQCGSYVWCIRQDEQRKEETRRRLEWAEKELAAVKTQQRTTSQLKLDGIDLFHNPGRPVREI